MMRTVRNVFRKLRGGIMARRIQGNAAPLSDREKAADRQNRAGIKNRAARRRAAVAKEMRAGAR